MAVSGRFVPNRDAPRLLARTVDMRRFLAAIAEEAADDARRLAPVASGRLRDSIASAAQAGPGGMEGLVGAGGDDAWYWHFIEFGTSRRAAAPYLRPAATSAIRAHGGRYDPA